MTVEKRRGTPRDMTKPNWKRTVTHARKMIEELRALDCEVREPDNFETPPSLRGSLT